MYINKEPLIAIPLYYIDTDIAKLHITLLNIDKTKKYSLQDIEESTKIEFQLTKECIDLIFH